MGCYFFGLQETLKSSNLLKKKLELETEVSSLQKALNKLNPGSGSTEGSVRYSYGIHVPFIMPAQPVYCVCGS